MSPPQDHRQDQDDNIYLTLAEAAKLTRCAERTLREWRRLGLIRTIVVGRKKLIARADVILFLDE